MFDAGDDDGTTAQPVAVLSHHFWRTRLDRAEDAIGRTVNINRREFTIIGVLPAGFGGVSVETQVDLWLPLSMTPVADPRMSAETIRSAGWSWLDIIARLPSGTTPEQLQAELDTRAQAQAVVLATQQRTHGIGPWRRVLPVQEAAVDALGSRGLKRNALLLAGVVLLALLLACANVAGLISVRAEEREHEFAIRTSLGASGAQLRRMLLLETLLLSGAGALAGLLLAQGLLHWVGTQAPSGIVLPVDVANAIVDHRVLLATTAVTVFVSLLVGVAPALRAGRVDAAPALKGGTTASADRRRVSWRGALVVTQIAISAVILAGAGLLLKSLWNTSRVDPGFDPRGAVAVMLDLSRHGMTPAEQRAFFQRVEARIAALPGVTAAGYSQTVPVQNGGWTTSVETDGPRDAADGNRYVDMFVITPGFLDALGVDVIAGRGIRPDDLLDDAAAVVLVNEQAAATFWPDGEAVGRRILNQGQDGARVVGVVANHKILSVRESPRAAMYVPLTQQSPGALNLVVRGARDERALLSEIRRVVRELDPGLPVLRERTLEQHLARSYSEARLFAWLLGGFALLAILLAAAGLYGMLMHALGARRRELGIRMALGAGAFNIGWLVARQIALLVGLGLAGGLIGALAAGRFLEGMLFGVGAWDAATFAGVALLVAAIALLAGSVPLYRAARTRPGDVLREE